MTSVKGPVQFSVFVHAVLAIVYPLMIMARVFAYNRDGRLDDKRVLGKYGHFFTGGCANPCKSFAPLFGPTIRLYVSNTDYKRENWRLYFFPIQHWLENVSFAMFAVSSHAERLF